MEYLNEQDRLQLLTAALKENKTFHLMLALSFAHGLRVTELLSLRAKDVSDDRIHIVALKRGHTVNQTVLVHSNPLIDCSPVFALAASLAPEDKLFNISRWTVNRWMKAIGTGIDPAKLHHHACRHSTAMFVYKTSQSLGQVSSILRHRSMASSMIYLREMDASKALAARDAAMAAMVSE
ncbi:MAG: site-specific integrase [Terriglobales bacterium]